MTALKNLGKLKGEAVLAPVLVTVMDGDRIGDYARMAQELRTAARPRHPGRAVPGQSQGFPKQLRYADRRGSPIAIIQGGDEKARASSSSRT
jgi:histidyl-tRNA synthetase